jgi:hypothetical protein
VTAQAPEPQAEPRPEPAAPDLGARVGRLETMISELKDAITGDGGPGSESAPEPPANVAEEIRRQIEDRDRKTASETAEAAKTDRLAAVETKLAELAEKAPEPVPRRVERFMGWR